MSDILQTSSVLINDSMKFSSLAVGNDQEIVTDYIPPFGEGKNVMPLQLFLISLATCFGGAISPFLRKMGKSVDKLTVNAIGKRKQTHPTCFETITLEIILHSKDTNAEDLSKIIALAEQQYCPVYAMIKENVPVKIESKILCD